MDSKQVIVMRKDLNMRKGKMIAQGAHASLKAFTQATAQTRWAKVANEWYLHAMTKICVGVGSEQELFDIYNAATQAGLPCALIKDAGHTEFNGVPTNTCLAIGPFISSEIDKITGHLKLL